MLAIVLAVTMGVVASVAVASHNGGLEGQWQLENIDSNRADDSSGHGRDAFPAYGELVPGRFQNPNNPPSFAGWALKLDAPDEGFQAPSPGVSGADFAIEGDLTVMAWVKAPASPGPFRRILAKEAGGAGCEGEGAYGLYTGENGGLEFSVGLYRNFQSRQVRTPAMAPEAIWNDQWHAIAGVFDNVGQGSEHLVGLWVDGRQVRAEEVPESYRGAGPYYNDATRDMPLFVGRRESGSEFANLCRDANGDNDFDYKGTIDEVRVYSRALEPHQIRRLQDAGETFPPTLDDRVQNVERPQISGTPKVGSELSCTEGSWSDFNSFTATTTYTWERAPRATRFTNDPAWAPIDGAASDRYTVKEEDAGSRVRCRVTRTNQVEEDVYTGEAVSRSLRADFDVPVNVMAPRITGIPHFNEVLTCDPGEWKNGPDPFSYQWLRDGQPIAGATGREYRPRQRRARREEYEVNPQGDGNHMISCSVIGTNDIGPSAPAVSPAVLAVDDVPYLPSGGPTIEGPDQPAVGDTLTCANGRDASGNPIEWIDGYGERGIEGYSLSWEWIRADSSNVETTIAGETARTYRVTTEDLGRNLRCRAYNENPLGRGRSFLSSAKLIPLPVGDNSSDVYRVGGNNQADPTNLLAVSQPYQNEVRRLVVERLRAGVQKARDECPEGLEYPAAKEIFGTETDKTYPPMTKELRCRILTHMPENRIRITHQGVFYRGGGAGIPSSYCAVNSFLIKCRDLNIQIAPVDPKKPPGADSEAIARLAPVTPERILWDLNRDGRTDASCPGTAPVLRTIYQGSGWKPRAVIVNIDSAETGRFYFGESHFDAHPKSEKARLRPAQVRVCATAFDPPPDPETRPCVTEGQIGRVRITGDLCPIDLRKINEDDFANFDGPLKAALLAQSQNRLKLEGIQTASRRREMQSTEPFWIEAENSNPSGVLARVSALGDAVAAQNPATRLVSGTYENTAASLSSSAAPLSREPTAALKQRLGNIRQNGERAFDVPDAGFALDQIYISRGEIMKVNGVGIDPLGDSGALLVPSDVKEAIGSVKSMQVSARDAATYLGGQAGIPLANGGNLKTVLSDKAAAAGQSLLRETNIDQLLGDLEKLKNQAGQQGNEAARRLEQALDKLDLGPFKLRGTAKVKIEDDGTATLDATAVLPGLKLGPGKTTEASATVKLRGDLEGRVKLQGIRIKPPGLAYLGGVALKDLDLAYDNGLDVKGKIVLPPPIGSGIAINRFRLGPQGQFQELDVDYLAGAGSGIKVGPGVFITKLGGGLCLERCEYPPRSGSFFDDILKARATVSVGPSTGGGCPTVGVEAELAVHFAAQFFIDAKGEVQIVCIGLVDLKFHADASGLVSISGNVHKDIGPIFIRGALGGDIRLPDWQVYYNAGGGIRDVPLLGDVELGFELVASNIGLAGCAGIETLLGDAEAGAAVRFSNGRPPFTPVELLANLRFFLGCDIGEYYSVVRRSTVRGAQAGSTTFEIPRGAGASLLSIEGEGGAPRVRLRTPSGQVLDFTDANGVEGKRIGNALGGIVEQEDRTIVLLKQAQAGTWTAEVAPDSPAIVRVQRAPILPDAKVTGRVTGRGNRLVLNYNVKPLDGQVVRLVEVAKGGRKVLRTVKRGGKGSVRFTPSEAQSARRQIVAEVSQDGLPRDNLTVARFTAPSPRVGKARKVSLRRRGARAIITWTAAPFAHSYEVAVTTGTGRRVLLRPRRGSRRAVVGGLRKNEGVVARVVAFSPAGKRGKYATGRLRGDMRVGSVRKAPKPRKPKRPRRRR